MKTLARKYGGTSWFNYLNNWLNSNGTIHISSIVDKGTKFVFHPCHANDLSVHEDLKISSKNKIEMADSHVRILVAEDNAMNQNLMRHLLTYWNLDFDIVNNGKEAIEALQQNNYRLVLMDIQMPLMDGYTTTLKIRNELGMNIPIIAMTAHAMAGEKEKCLSYGMNEYISKPLRRKL
jgi:CheY-like chemotaxis protein